ncbi:uncharacterized protein [Aristolochia californica]|uniref:uncharacterized protein isoform X2 n=1 Tax=Aristolochia californica TaxID=171875 RepID=UPI0035DDD55F
MSQNNIPPIEVFWSLVNKADKKFSRVRDLPFFVRNRFDLYFQDVFKVYTQLWKFQKDNRQKLVESGLKRWEIGEIASRIAQLHYGQYLRTSDTTYLSESYTFYEAILTREYFKEGASQNLSLARKQLRCLARFMVVCLVCNRREMVPRLLNQLRSTVEECKTNFNEADFKDWKLMIQDLIKFLKADTAFMNMRPLRYSLVLDLHPDSFPVVASVAAKRLRLRDAILCSYQHNEVKFAELILNTYRMLQCLEWEPRGSFYVMPGDEVGGVGSDNAQNVELGPNRIASFPGITDPALPPNPQKAILYRPTIIHFIAVLAMMCEGLPPDGVLLIYLSASGTTLSSDCWASAVNTTETAVETFQSLDLTSNVFPSPKFSHDSPTHGSSQDEGTQRNHEDCLCLGSFEDEGKNFLCPGDLIPFTRKPLFLIVDSENSHTFKAIHGMEKGERTAMLLSPSSPSPAAAGDGIQLPDVNQFTVFLTAPLQAFCMLLGLPGTNIEKETYWMAEKLLSSLFNNWGFILATSDSLDPVWAQVLLDPFLRRFLLRFLFCRAVLALYAPTSGKSEFLPECIPLLPNSLLPSSEISQSAIWQLANVFSGTNHFVFSVEESQKWGTRS